MLTPALNTLLLSTEEAGVLKYLKLSLLKRRKVLVWFLHHRNEPSYLGSNGMFKYCSNSLLQCISLLARLIFCSLSYLWVPARVHQEPSTFFKQLLPSV